MKNITILTVSFRSGVLLNRLFNNIIKKANYPDMLKFLVVDNTFGEDPDMSAYAEFLTVVTKTEAEAQATHGYFYPKSYKDQQGGVEDTSGKTDDFGRYTEGAGKLNCKYIYKI